MKNISLLPPEIKEEIKKKQNLRYYFYTALGIFLLFIIFYSSMFIMTLNYNSLAESTRQQRHNSEIQAAGMAEYDTMRINAEEAERILRQALGKTPEWDKIMEDIGFHIPGDVWITNISAVFEDEDGTVKIQGWGSSYESVATWLRKINAVKGVKNVRCHYSEMMETDGKPAISFEIKGDIEPGEPFERMIEGKVF